MRLELCLEGERDKRAVADPRPLLMGQETMGIVRRICEKGLVLMVDLKVRKESSPDTLRFVRDWLWQCHDVEKVVK